MKLFVGQKPTKTAWVLWGSALVFALAGLGWSGYTLTGQIRAALAWNRIPQLIDSKDFEKAEKDLELARSVWPDSGEVLTVSARVARHLGKFESANRFLDQARDLGAEENQVQVERALLRALSGDLSGVERYLGMMGAKESPFHREIVSTLTPLYYSTFDMNKANATSKYWIEVDPTNPEAFQWRGLILDRVGARIEAEECLRKAIELDPDRLDVHIYLASRSLRYGDPQAALISLAKAESLNPNHIDLPLLKARALSETGKEEEGRALLVNQVKTDPDPALFRELGSIELKMGRNKEALEHMQTALKAFPMDHSLLFRIAQAQDQMGLKEEAAKTRERQKGIEADLDRIKGVTKTIIDRPNDPSPRVEAAKIMEKNGVAVEACRWAMSALRLQPNNPDAIKIIENNKDAASKANQYRSVLEFLR